MGYHIFKLATGRLCAVCLGLCVLFGTLCLTGSFSALGGNVVGAAATGDSAAWDVNTPEGRVSFLQSFGWEAEEAPTLTKEITIPKTFDEVYTQYNEEIQLPEGYDLRRYAGKQVTLYVYRILNYPTEDEVTANLLVAEGKVVGGDICSARLDGFMHGFTPPDGILAPTLSQLVD